MFTFIVLAITLAGCSLETTIDSSSAESIKTSVEAMKENLDKPKQELLSKSIGYFSMRGIDLFSKSQISPKDQILANLLKIEGLNAEEVIAKYKKIKAEDDELKSKLKLEKDKIAKQKKDERLKVTSLKSEAKKLLDSKQFKSAIDKYTELATIESGIEIAEKGIADTQKEMKEFQEMVEYIEKIEITEFNTTRIDTYSSKNTPAVRISLKNNGDRTLTQVTTVVYFQDKNGKNIYEEKLHPVTTSIYSMRKNKPLKPGYIKEMEAGKYYTIDSPLSEWVTGKATIKITKVKFSDKE